MENHAYLSIKSRWCVNRRDFLKAGSAAGFGLLLGAPPLWSQEAKKDVPPENPKTNIEEALKIPRTKNSLPGPFPGRVVEVHEPNSMKDEKPDAEVVQAMFRKGLSRLTGKDEKESFDLFFNKNDVVGIKVNPVGAGLISTRLCLVDAIVEWLRKNGVKGENVIIWDRFDFMLAEAGFTKKRYPDLGIEGLQTMNQSSQEEEGTHVSASNFDMNVYYWADVEGLKDKTYLNQHVFNGKYSYFGRLLTQKLTKIINVPVFKNAGNSISMATKNLGYGSICNTNRLHAQLFFETCTEPFAFPVLRDKLVLNVTDGLRAQYDGGPMPAAKFTYLLHTLFFATDPFALDLICHQKMVEKRKSMKIRVDEHPRYTEFFRYAQRLGLGIGDREKIEHICI